MMSLKPREESLLPLKPSIIICPIISSNDASALNTGIKAENTAQSSKSNIFFIIILNQTIFLQYITIYMITQKRPLLGRFCFLFHLFFKLYFFWFFFKGFRVFVVAFIVFRNFFSFSNFSLLFGFDFCIYFCSFCFSYLSC